MLRPYSCPLSVGAKHLEDKLSVITKNSSPNASPVQLSVGAKHLEDKLSVIAKNSSPNASPVQLSVVRQEFLTITYYLLPKLIYPIVSTIHYPFSYPD
ncbi:hypothetical protein PN450_07530 [Dolichospermum lemmermannii CS-548]|nr:hypothetical protein [Dolichospermum lemmermannii CS-548]